MKTKKRLKKLKKEVKKLSESIEWVRVIHNFDLEAVWKEINQQKKLTDN